MSEPSPLERRRAAALAGHTGDRDTARDAIQDPDPHVRAAALRSLERSGELDRDDLEGGLGDPHPHVRLTALELAAHRDEPSVQPLLDDTDPSVVEMAAWACGERPGTPETISHLTRLAATHDDPLVREAAVAALGAIGDEAGLPAVLDAMNDKPAVRRRAVVALAAFDGPEVEAAWHRARSDRDRQVREAVDELNGGLHRP